MKRLVLSMAVAPMLLGSFASLSAADDGFKIFDEVKFKGELRPRAGYVDSKAISDAGVDAGMGLTNRTNLNFSAKLFQVDGLNTEIELNSVNDFGTQGDATQQQLGEKMVAKVSQANISYGTKAITGLAGRKTVNLDNQRFIGSVGWKQNFQTLDLVAVTGNAGFEKLSYLVAYVYGVSAIADAGNGADGANPAYTGGVTSGYTTSVATNVSYKIIPEAKVTAYAYMLGSYSDTFGASITGDIEASKKIKLNYRAEYAMQKGSTLETGHLGVTKNKNSKYMNFDLGANLYGALVGFNYELLGGRRADDSASSSFQTPLATKHKFNGFADQFLVTPDAGLVDMNFRVGYKAKGIGKLIAWYHMFSTQTKLGGVDTGSAYGNEIDLVYANKISSVDGLSVLLKGAMFMNDDTAAGLKKPNAGAGAYTDRTMAWAMLDYKFATK